jgi:hypothetical protein
MRIIFVHRREQVFTMLQCTSREEHACDDVIASLRWLPLKDN